MGMLRNLRHIKDAMKPAAIKQGLEASRAEWSGSSAGPSEEQLAALTPEQRSAYEANRAQVARAQAEVAAQHQELVDRELERRALYGPAGEYVYGEMPSDPATMTVEESMARSKEQFHDLLRHPFRAPRPPGARDAPPAPREPVDRDQQAAAERAAR